MTQPVAQSLSDCCCNPIRTAISFACHQQRALKARGQSPEYSDLLRLFDSTVNLDALDKTGGLTEAQRLVGLASKLGIKLMAGPSLAMAPVFFIEQLCHFVDLDGTLFQSRSRTNSITYSGGVVIPPDATL